MSGSGPMVGPLLDDLPLDPVHLYWMPDGSFPDHEPNPLLEENRQLVIDTVLSEGADLGIAWDGDADRCFFIDETGRFVDGDFLTALLVSEDHMAERRDEVLGLIRGGDRSRGLHDLRPPR